MRTTRNDAQQAVTPDPRERRSAPPLGRVNGNVRYRKSIGRQMVTDATQSELWSEVSNTLRHHQKKQDETPIDALNRLFREYFPTHLKIPLLNESTTRLQKESRTINELKKVIRRDCLTKGPDKIDVSVVLVKWCQNEYLVDGRRRTNLWAGEGSDDPHPVIVIQCQ